LWLVCQEIDQLKAISCAIAFFLNTATALIKPKVYRVHKGQALFIVTMVVSRQVN
jgi:hypothetical protein